MKKYSKTQVCVVLQNYYDPRIDFEQTSLFNVCLGMDKAYAAINQEIKLDNSIKCVEKIDEETIRVTTRYGQWTYIIIPTDIAGKRITEMADFFKDLSFEPRKKK